MVDTSINSYKILSFRTNCDDRTIGGFDHESAEYSEDSDRNQPLFTFFLYLMFVSGPRIKRLFDNESSDYSWDSFMKSASSIFYTVFLWGLFGQNLTTIRIIRPEYYDYSTRYPTVTINSSRFCCRARTHCLRRICSETHWLGVARGF